MPFLDKVLPRLDRVDRDRLEGILKAVAGERDFLEHLINLLGEGVVVTDRDGRITFVNRAAEALLGMGGDSLGGRELRGVVRDPRLREMVEEVLRERVGIMGRNISLEQPSRDHITASAVPLGTPSGEFGGAVFMLRNTTAEILSQLRYGQMRQLQTFGIMAAGIAHEIGNPLNSLDIHLQLIKRKIARMRQKGQGELLALLDVAQEEIRRLEQIVGRFLTATRAEAPEMVESDIVPVIEKTLSFMEPELTRHGIAIETAYAPFVPPLMLDADRIRQVFINLIRNAIQAMPEGGVLRVAVSYSRGQVLASVSDRGQGIPEDQRERIFEPYFTTRAEGTGLGLMIVQRIVSEHGGEVLVASSEGKGTTMTVKLPVPSKYGRLLTGRRQGARRARGAK